MADDVRDPFAAAEMSGLRSELKGLRTDLLGVRGDSAKAAAGIDDLKKRARREAAAVTTPAAITRNIDEAAASLRQPAARLQAAVGGGRLAEAIRAVQEAVDPVLLAARSLQQRPGGATTPSSVERAAEAVRKAVTPPPPPRPLSEAPVLAAAGAGGGGKPPLKTLLPGFDPGEEGPRFKLNADDVQLYERAVDGAGRSTRDFEGELQRLTRESALGGDQMRRHGLLTTEFLEAAAAGRVTVRELGVQIGGTIAKFGGWTTAAALTYGGLAAIQAVGHGAVQSLQGVTDLQRVVNNLDTSKAQSDFRALAREFNLPIDDVTAAAFEASKAFKDQDDILAATRAALFGVKIGELDAGTAAKFATATVRGFKLEAQDLGSVIDVVNQLQNRFGANFAQTAQGVAAAAGAFGAAGGTYQELASLVAAGQLATGKTGNEIATALRRTAEITGRPERRQTIIDVLGIDPQDTSITKIIERAQELVSRGADPATIARAITTPELASGRIIPILRSQELYKAALAETRRAEGSAERERAIALQSLNEEIKQIGVNLQRLGSVLAQSGALDAAGGLLQLLNLTLATSTQLLEVFNQLPQPLRQGLAVAAQLFAAGALARRFDVGGSLREGSFLNRALRRNPTRLERAEILQGLTDERQFITTARMQAGNRAASLYYRAGQQQNRRDSLVAVAQSADATEDDARRALAAQRKLERLQGELADAEEEAADLKGRQRALADRQVAFARSTTRRGGGDPRAEANRLGILYSSPIDSRPTSRGPFRLDDERETPSGIFVPGASARNAAQAGETAVAREVDSARAGVRLGVDRAAARAKSGLGRAATGGANLARSIAASLGPLEFGILGLIGGAELYNAYQQSQRRARERVDEIRNLPRTASPADAIRRAEEELRKEERPSLKGTARFGRAPEVDTDAAQASRETISIAQQLQARGPLYHREEIRERLTAALRRGQPGAFKQAVEEANEARGLVLAQLELDAAEASGDKGRIDKARTSLNRAKEDVRVFLEEVRNRRQTMRAIVGEYDSALSLEELQQANTVALFLRGPTRSVVAGNAKVLQARLRDLIVSDDPKARADQIQGIQAVQSQLTAALDAQLQRALSGASPRQARGLQRNYVTQLRKIQQQPVERLLKSEQESVREIENELQATKATQIPVGADRAAPFLARRREELRQLRESLGTANRRAGDLRSLLRITTAQINAIEREQREQRFDTRTDAFDARTERLQSEQTTDSGKQEVLRQRLRDKVGRFRRAVRAGVKDQADLDRIIAEYNNSRQQAVDDALALFDAQQGLDAANYAGSHLSEESRMRFAISQANQRLSKLRSTGGKKVDLISQQRAVQEAENALAEYLRSQAEDLVRAQTELALSRTTNPVRQARIRYRESITLRKFADTPAERIRAEAEVRNRRRDVANAEVNRAADDIQFDLDMGRIESSAAARRFRALARSIKGNRDLKRELLRRAKALEGSDSTELELTPGNVHLPTLAEIRKFRPGVAGATSRVSHASINQSRNQVVHNRNTVIVHVQKGSEDKVFEALEQALGDVKVTARARRPG